ncbi:hypothetical protein B0J18DRAFT_87196 [Chaetomium sp. MPI-SDFR-AT-0129]|nr:hypothetical protein B0J18DRAFT_87196 [Chaetomium sp. MPI-SDFR-AT-0129]
MRRRRFPGRIWKCLIIMSSRTSGDTLSQREGRWGTWPELSSEPGFVSRGSKPMRLVVWMSTSRASRASREASWGTVQTVQVTVGEDAWSSQPKPNPLCRPLVPPGPPHRTYPCFLKWDASGASLPGPRPRERHSILEGGPACCDAKLPLTLRGSGPRPLSPPKPSRSRTTPPRIMALMIRPPSPSRGATLVASHISTDTRTKLLVRRPISLLPSVVRPRQPR